MTLLTEESYGEILLPIAKKLGWNKSLSKEEKQKLKLAAIRKLQGDLEEEES